MLKDLFSVSTRSKLTDCFKHLDELEKGLAKKVAEYIIDGEEVSVLTSLKALGSDQLKNSGVWFPHMYLYEKNQKAWAKRIKHFKKSIKSLLTTDFLTNAQYFRRFGAVILECTDFRSHTLHYFSKEVPDWLGVVLSILPDTIAGDGYHERDRIPAFYTGRWIDQVISENELSNKVKLAILLERDYTWGFTGNFMTHLVETADWDQILGQEDFIQICDSLNFSARVTTATHLLKYPRIDEHLNLVGSLITDKSKQVREQAKLLLSKVDNQKLYQYVFDNFSSFTAPRRKELAKLVSIFGDEHSSKLLEHILENETSKSVVEVIQATIANKNAAQAPLDKDLVIPDFEPLDNNIRLPESWLNELEQKLQEQIERARKGAEEEQKHNKENGNNYSWQKQHYKRISKLTTSDIKQGIAFLETGKGKLNHELIQIFQQLKLQQRPEFKLSHILRILIADDRRDVRLDWGMFPQWLPYHKNDLVDLRQLAQLLIDNKIDHRCIAQWLLRSRWESHFELEDTGDILLWPFFHQHPDYLKEAFGLVESKETGYSEFELGYGILIAASFPVIPEQFLQVMYQYALSPAKTYGPLSRTAIENYGIVTQRVIDALKSSKQDERIVAANWIADLKLSEAIEPITKALKKEKRETAKAALLSALHKLGQDISEYLSPEALLKEAETGLKKALPKGISWFPFNSLAELKWQTGERVKAEIIKWWIVLACKLKQPEGNPLLDLYLDQLDVVSQKTLGAYILQVFIGHDTDCPSDTEAKEYASSHQQSRLDSYRQWAKYDWGSSYKDKTLEDAFQSLFAEKKAEYLGSAIGEKGILCLSARMEGADAVQVINRYMKDHYTRRHQIEAMISSLANNNDPVIIQLLLAMARRHRTNSIQEKAKALVTQIAQRNNWTQDELADRTIPTAGLDASGTHILQLGSRELTVKLGSDLKIVLENEQGKVLKSLPAARQDDDADQVKQAKKDFSTAKKELKQVVEFQSNRLYEAMCTGRKWVFAEWKQYLLEHPVVTHLVQRLVWNILEDDRVYQIRPTAELELIDLDDEDVYPTDSAEISVSHISDLDALNGKNWLKSFKDEKIKPLFDQFTVPVHELTEQDLSATRLDFHEGWMTDTFTLRGILSKRGYKRGEAEDGGYFTHYFKDFSSLDLRLIIEFSGNCLPEENLAAALFHIAFVKPDNRGWISEDAYMKINEVPINLVNEAMLDYEAVAAKATYDENWKTKVPW